MNGQLLHYRWTFIIPIVFVFLAVVVESHISMYVCQNEWTVFVMYLFKTLLSHHVLCFVVKDHIK